MKNTFVATTTYHLYLIILLIENNRLTNALDDNLLVIIEHTDGINLITDNLVKYNYFRKVIVIPNKRKQKNKLGKFNYLFNRKKLVSILDSTCEGLKEEEEFINNSKIYISDIDSTKNYFYFKFKLKKFSMIESGSLTYIMVPSKSLIFKKRILQNGFIENGYDDISIVEEVYAISPEKLPEVLRKKSVKIDINKISESLSDKSIETIFKVFNFEISLDKSKKKALVITQPLYIESLVKTEDIKINIFKDLISKIPKDYKIFIKTHPRENTDYTKHFTNVTVFPKLFPAELFLLLGKDTFDVGYTLFSTALSNLGHCVTNRKFVALDYIDQMEKNQNGIREAIKLYVE